jgi:hypothetical protein
LGGNNNRKENQSVASVTSKTTSDADKIPPIFVPSVRDAKPTSYTLYAKNPNFKDMETTDKSN